MAIDFVEEWSDGRRKKLMLSRMEYNLEEATALVKLLRTQHRATDLSPLQLGVASGQKRKLEEDFDNQHETLAQMAEKMEE